MFNYFVELTCCRLCVQWWII